MKTFVKVLLGVVAVAVVAVAAVFYFTSGMVDTADSFFKALKARDMTTARSYLAEDFKAATDEKALTDFVSRSALLNFKECSWSNRKVSGGRGELDGSVTSETGGVVPVKLMFVKENSGWKIYSIQKPMAGLQTESSTPAVPAKADQVALVKQSIHDFVVSVGRKNMEHFRSTLSQLWQKQHTTEYLNAAYKSIIDTDANWAVLDSREPILAGEPTIGENGVLVLTGHYATKPSQVFFEQKYIYEGIAWKLVGFNIEAK